MKTQLSVSVVLQENFELYHETLYLAVKITDHYLSKTPVHREMLQLVGSTAMLIASKFEVSLWSLQPTPFLNVILRTKSQNPDCL